MLQICTWKRQCGRQDSKWMIVPLDDTSQRCTHEGPYWDWQTCNFVVWPTTPCSMSWQIRYSTVTCASWMPCALTDDKKQPDWWPVSVMYSVIQQREEQSMLSHCWWWETNRSFHSRQWAIDHGVGRPSSPRTLSASKVLGSVFWIYRVYCRWTSWNVDVQLTPSSVPHWKACHRPPAECPSLRSDGVILLRDNTWPHTAQQNSGSEMLDHTVQIWHPLILYISHLEWSLITTLSHRWWRHQAC